MDLVRTAGRQRYFHNGLASRPTFGSVNGRHGVPSWTKNGRQPLKCKAQAEVSVEIELKREVAFGEEHRVVGGCGPLGDWNVGSALKLQWNDGHVWKASVKLPTGKPIEFKCIRVSKDNVVWEDGENRKVQLSTDGADDMKIVCKWGRTKETTPATFVASPSFSDAAGSSQDGAAARSRSPSPGPQSEAKGSMGWMGKEVVFMRSNEHSRDRTGSWNTAGLTGVAAQLVEGDKGAPNWLQKLKLAQSLLAPPPKSAGLLPRLPDVPSLAHAYVYLAWVASGAVPCVEGGGHYRPNHHAEAAKTIFVALERVIGDGTTPAVPKFLGRKLTTKIPAFTQEFRASVPLTRIRDIAHRSDIPHDLKQQIKHTLQNKLHRNAGPEDLVAAEAMYERLNNERGNYSQGFMSEFELFLAELRDFFNAKSLSDLLSAIISGQEDASDAGATVQRFLNAKAKLDSHQHHPPPLNDLMDALHSVTTVRAVLTSGLNSGLRNDAPDSALEQRQRWRLAEIRAEEYFFVTLSRVVGHLESQGGPGALAGGSDNAWAQPLGALVLALRNVGLSGWEWGECAALDQEIAAWQAGGKLQEKQNALRLKATLERVQRLTQNYTDSLLGIFAEPARTLGGALDVAPHAVNVFTESEVREGVVFQLSRLCSLVLKATRQVAGAGVWDSIVSGTATGELMSVQRIDAASLLALTRDVVLLVREADGDEELGAAGSRLKGVVLCQGLPHLSHLGVRARQERVPFVAVEEQEFINSNIQPLVGKQVTLQVEQDGASLKEGQLAQQPVAAAAKNGNGNGNGNGASNGKVNGKANGTASVLAVKRVDKAAVVPLAQATSDTSGAKAAACARLEQIASKSSGAAQFRAPGGLVVPFGSLAVAVAEAGKAADFAAAMAELNSLAADRLDGACAVMEGIVRGLPLPRGLSQKILGGLDPSARVMVRSSANVEDLEGMSGAGLYDSIANVDASSAEQLAGAATKVWASLYTRRAVLARRAASVAQTDADMALLVQEMVDPEYAFVIHTASPFRNDPDTAYVEVAVGLGETLASGKRGSPWRLSVHKPTGKVETLAFANFSQSLVPVRAGRAGGGAARLSLDGGAATATATVPEQEHVTAKTVDYSKVALTLHEEARVSLAKRIGAIAALLEAEFGCPQDVEGCVKGDTIYIVQSRPQP